MNQPRFRTDLVTSPASESGKRFVDVTDPDSGQTFRFYEVEYAVATAMNGERDVDQLVDWARSELGLSPSKAEVETVISTLDALGYLSDSSPDADQGSAGADASAPTAPADPLDIGDLSLGAPGKSPIRADERRRREASNVDLGNAGKSPMSDTKPPPARETKPPELELGAAGGVESEPEPMTGAGSAPPLDLPLEMEAGEPPEAFPKPAPSPTPFPAPSPAQPSAQSPAMEPKKTLMGMSPMSLDDPKLGPAPAQATSAPNVPAGKDLSVDLGQHINIGTDDVKEAVRASRVMNVPDVPFDQAPPDSAPKFPQTAASTPLGSTPIELPGRPPAAPAAPAPAPGPNQPLTSTKAGPSLVTILLGVLLIAAIAGAAYYFLIHTKEDTAAAKPKPVGDAEKIATKPATPSGPVGMVTKGDNVEGSVKATRGGKLAWLIAAESMVEKGDVIAKLEGFEKEEKALGETAARRDTYQNKLDKATAAGNKSAMRNHEADVKRKQKQVDEIETRLNEFMIRAPNAGTVTLKLTEKGSAIDEDTEIATVSAKAWPMAEFTIKDAEKYKVGEKLEVVGKSDPTQTAICEIVSLDGSVLRIKCPPESNLKENAALTLR